MGFAGKLRAVFARNKLLIGVIALVFVSIMVISTVVAYAILATSPGLVESIGRFLGSMQGGVSLPEPYTIDFYRLIFLNNIGHFWNPVRAWVWIPFVGAFSLGYELLFNAILIGGVASFAGISRGAGFAIAGLTPHGVIEIPAFILEFAGLARWHITTTRAIHTKLSGGKVDRPLLIQGIKDTIVLSVFSVLLFAIAAYVETYVTPHLLEL